MSKELLGVISDEAKVHQTPLHRSKAIGAVAGSLLPLSLLVGCTSVEQAPEPEEVSANVELGEVSVNAANLAAHKFLNTCFTPGAECYSDIFDGEGRESSSYRAISFYNEDPGEGGEVIQRHVSVGFWDSGKGGFVSSVSSSPIQFPSSEAAQNKDLASADIVTIPGASYWVFESTDSVPMLEEDGSFRPLSAAEAILDKDTILTSAVVTDEKGNDIGLTFSADGNVVGSYIDYDTKGNVIETPVNDQNILDQAILAAQGR